MNDPSRQPVIIGVGQRTDRHPDVDSPVSPLEMMADAVEIARLDAGGIPLAGVDLAVTIEDFSWNAHNQAGTLAQRVGAHAAHPVQTANGGDIGIVAVNWIAQRIADGTSSLALLTGANVMRSRELAARRGEEHIWDDDTAGQPETLGVSKLGHSPFEVSAGMDMPTSVYPLFENALRHHFGRSLDEHRTVMGDLFAKFTDVAATNPHAWFPTRRSAEEIITPTPQNRMVAYPYTKYLNAILNTDQSAALILTSAAEARRLGVPEDQWIHWWGGNAAQEQAFYVSTRPDFAATPSMLDSHRGALENAGIGIDDVDLIDFYSCFPAAVEMAIKMLGLDRHDSRGFTVTGGLPYAGGPGSGYTLHSLAAMAERLREREQATGLVTGNGWYLSKHAASVWSTHPFPGERLASDRPGPQPSEQFDTAPLEPAGRSGTGTVETYTVLYDREQTPTRGIVLGRYDDGGRFLANAPTGTLSDFVAEEQIGRRGTVTADSPVARFEPGD